MIQELSKKKKFLKNNKNKQKNNKFKKNYQKNLNFKKTKYNIEDNSNSKKKKKIPKFTNYLHTNKKLKQGIFFKKPAFNEIIYPFSLNLKLINEYLKKK